MIWTGANEAHLFAVLAFFAVGSTLGQSPEPAKIASPLGIWNGFQTDLLVRRHQKYRRNASRQRQMFSKTRSRYSTASRDARLRCLRSVRRTIHPGAYQIAICSAFKGAKQQEAIIAKIPAQAAWSEAWKSMEGIDPPRGFALLVQDWKCGHWHLLAALEKQSHHSRR